MNDPVRKCSFKPLGASNVHSDITRVRTRSSDSLRTP